MPRDARWEALRRLVIYEVFPRVHSTTRDFAGLKADLGRIAALGVDVVYLMPVHPIGESHRKGRWGSPYSIRDYRAIDPMYGTEDDLRDLVDAAHGQGLKVMMDIVYSHTSHDSVLREEHPEWFYRNAAGEISSKNPLWSDVIDLDYAQAALWDYQIETLCHWASLGVDGFRCDVAPLIPLEFWKEARRRVAEIRDVIWLAESGWMRFVKKDTDLGIRHLTDPELHQAFDITYDADGGEYLLKYFRGEASIRDYLHQVFLQEVLYPYDAIKLRFLECHDDLPFASKVRDPETLRCWTAFSFLLPGATMLFAGQELAIREKLEGDPLEPKYHDHDQPVDWAAGDAEFSGFTRSLISVTKEIKARCRVCHVREITRGVVLTEWTNAEERFLAILNLEGKCGTIPVDLSVEGNDLLTGAPVDISSRYAIRPGPVLLKTRPASNQTRTASWHV